MTITAEQSLLLSLWPSRWPMGSHALSISRLATLHAPDVQSEGLRLISAQRQVCEALASGFSSKWQGSRSMYLDSWSCAFLITLGFLHHWTPWSSVVVNSSWRERVMYLWGGAFTVLQIQFFLPVVSLYHCPHLEQYGISHPFSALLSLEAMSWGTTGTQ